MKYSYLFLVLFLIQNSCSKNEELIETQDFAVNEFPQKWKLMKMTGNFQDSEKTGEDMLYQENYFFKSDGTFVKTRIEDGKETSAEGQYIFQKEELSFLLTHNSSNQLIGNCSNKNIENLYFDNNGDYLLSNWWACDGPGLYYKRIE